jgi:guanylate kinase
MNRLIVIAGASGAGKSFLLQQMSEIDARIVPVKKLSTRSPRPYEDTPGQTVDLIFDCTSEQIRSCKYTYRYEGNSYGIRKEDIDRVIKDGNLPFVIVRDCEEILELKKDYVDALVLYIQSGLSGADLARVLKQQGRSEIDIRTRDERSRKDHAEYVRYPELFDYTLVNYFEPDSLIDHFKHILRIERARPSVVRGHIFVIMSFSKELRDVYEEMKFAVEAQGGDLKIQRIDDKFGDYKITEEVLKEIQEAELLICDLTDERPNVYFELGYARGITKTVILTAKQGTNIHFDVRHYKVVFYSSPTELKTKLQRELTHFFNR